MKKKYKLGDTVKVVDSSCSSLSTDDIGIITEQEFYKVIDGHVLVLDILANFGCSYSQALDMALFTVKQTINAIPVDVVSDDGVWVSNDNIKHWEHVYNTIKELKEKHLNKIIKI